MSYYLETLFPKLNIRFLSVEDEYDSQRMEDRERLGAKMLELERAEYAKEQSRRILAAKKKASLPSKVPYGYLRSEKTQSLLVDEETAPYVRMIFQWALLGVSRRGIAERLNLLRLATPGQRQESGRLKVSFSETKWTIGAVQKILSNPTYSGDLATGRLRQSLYEGIRQYATKPSEWIIQKQSHEPMVAGDDWEEWSKRQK
ncbi:MAG: recombinase family protein [bacterium]|nr:recombinase family protein [bacterium]